VNNGRWSNKNKINKKNMGLGHSLMYKQGWVGIGRYQAMLLELHHAAPAHRHRFDDLGYRIAHTNENKKARVNLKPPHVEG
jgi:hypothetical protein